jgi:hypothetical protein
VETIDQQVAKQLSAGGDASITNTAKRVIETQIYLVNSR